LLVSGYDEINNKMIVSIPTDQDLTSRVSVDAIEHYLIYENFPEVGAIVHVHAWISGIKSTEQHHPCGSRELAEAVVEILSELPDPGKAVIGLKNHGLTITGNNLEEIFDRIGNKLNTNVPMFE
jgi:ribulose-5-phosphate 4-epimerase/fuculose-1-phosphate aldolase